MSVTTVAITTMAGMVRVDGFGVYLGIIVVIATALALLVSVAYLRREQLEAPEYLALMLFSALGMVIMTTANNLIVVFLALEVLSIPLYVLAAFDRRRLSSQEAGIKYFVLGAFSSAIFLYGIALVYGATGTTSLTGISRFLAENTLFETGTLVAGFALLLVGLGFKVAAVPFHTWTPDVYQGAPTPITAFMASATKTAGFAALLRVFLVAFPLYRTDWRPAVWVLAVLSLSVGSIGAALQTDVKRLLAYSSIAHAGYVLMGFDAATARGREASLFYLFVYTFMVVGSFAVVSVITMKGDDDHSIDGYRGLAFRRPVLGSLLIFFLLAQAGIPLTGGFIAKLEVFEAASRGQGVRARRHRRGCHGDRRLRVPAARTRGGEARDGRRSGGSCGVTSRPAGSARRRVDRCRARGHRCDDVDPRSRAGGLRRLGPPRA